MFNWCFIGTGKIANKVAKQVVTNPGHKIVSVYNRTKKKAEKFAKKFNSKVYESALEAINDPQVDGVYIATTNETHFSYCKLCLENHKPVLCEKPITGNAKELEELIKLSKENKTMLKEAMWTWYNPVANKVKQWIKEERIGKILSVDCIFNMPIFGYNKAKGRYISPARYGGALLDLGVYSVRYVYELFGKPNEIISRGKLYNGIDLFNVSSFKYDGFELLDIFYANNEMPGARTLEGIEGVKEVFRDKKKKFATEFRVVGEYMKGEKPDELVSLESSLEVLQIMDEIRRQIGVKFPCD